MHRRTSLGLINDGGVLILDPAGAATPLYPTSSAGLLPGALYSIGGAIAIMPTTTPNALAPRVLFGFVSAAQLLGIGGGDFLFTSGTVGSLILWNNGGLACVS